MRRNSIPAVIGFAPGLLLPLIQDVVRPRVAHSSALGFVLGWAPDFVVAFCFPFSILVRPRAWTATTGDRLFGVWAVFTLVAIVGDEVFSPFGLNVFDVSDIAAGIAGVCLAVIVFRALFRRQLTFGDDEPAMRTAEISNVPVRGRDGALAFGSIQVVTGDASVLVEACVDSVASSLAAEHGGARRLELCDALCDGGTTPSAGMIAACKAAVSIPLFVMIRPRGGGFVYSDVERDVMRRDVVVAREVGADGVVIGGLRPDGSVDLALVRSLVQAAQKLPVTFHRAFDLTPDLASSLESLADAGVRRILTSGGAATAPDGATVLAELVRQAGSRVVVMAGGGVREENVRGLVSVSGVREVHVRLTRLARGESPPARRDVRVRKPLPDDESAWEETDEARVRSFVVTVTR